MGFEIQKAGFWKRASAFLLDFILRGILIVGILAVLSAVSGYDRKTERMQELYDEYSAKYGTDLGMSEADFNALSKEDQDKYSAAYDALTNDAEAMELYRSVMKTSLITLTASFFIAYLVLDFIVPLLFREGRTLGKKVFGLCVVHTNCVRMEPGAMFVRTFLGKFTIEGMIPVLTLIMLYFGMVGLAGTAVILVLLLVQIILMIATQNNQLIHDLLAQSAVADYQSQPIYATLDELNQAKARKAAEAARLTPYD